MASFRPVDQSYRFPERELLTLRFWKEERIFERSLDGNERPAPRGPFLFYEGPPTANGKPHAGNALTRVIKDLFPRYKTMCGYRVERKGGWDTHGLPVEIEVEKELGISGKDQIEKYGIEPFVKRCMESVFRYTRQWEELTDRIGFWLDQKGAYVTYHKEYVESVWWSLRQLFDRGLLYRGHKTVPWCPRCGTALSSHEVGQGYEKAKDPSVYVGFRTRSDPRTYFLAWTTTPWTLLSNAALAVKADVDYAYVKVKDETLVMAAALVAPVMGKMAHEVARTVKGADLAGMDYEPLYGFARHKERAHYVVTAEFVGLDTGTGIVHIAPGYGADDHAVGLQHKLPMIQLVDQKGEVADEVTPWRGKSFRAVNDDVMRDLKERGLLLKKEVYEHDYPHCWRCHQPLIYYARDSWFIRTTQQIGRIIQNNKAVTWQPETVRDGRFGNFLESNVDWALSRERYWGTPLPIWRCEPCGTYEAFASREEMLARNPRAFDSWQALRAQDPALDGHLQVHKPYIDSVTLPCATCGSAMRRVPEVIDCWYDSGAMPFAQWGYPHAPGSKERFESTFPCDFISEAVDQTRGWFYSLLAISTLVFPDASVPHPYRRCIVLGHITDKQGKKYSKHLKNYVPVEELIGRLGADAVRWFFLTTARPMTNVKLSEDAIEECKRDFLLRLYNVYSFFVIYANIDGYEPGRAAGAEARRTTLDDWILSELELLTRSVRASMDAFDIPAACASLFDFVDALSNWYLRRSRDRFWRHGDPMEDADKNAAYQTLGRCLVSLSRLLAPFVPFFSEELHQNLVRGVDPSASASVHLTDYPEPNEAWIDLGLSRRMGAVREVVSLGRAARADAKLKTRLPLSRAEVLLADPSLRAEIGDLWGLVKDELNVKQIEFPVDAHEYVDVKLKLNFPLLGPRLGPRMKALQAALASKDAAALKAMLDVEGKVTIQLSDGAVELDAEALKVEIESKEGFAARSSKVACVALDTHVTEDLRVEGVARELSSVINGWRSDLALPYEARIEVEGCAGPAVREALARHRDWILGETLAVDIRLEDGGSAPPEGALAAEIEGNPVWALVTRVQ